MLHDREFFVAPLLGFFVFLSTDCLIFLRNWPGSNPIRRTNHQSYQAQKRPYFWGHLPYTL